MDGSLQVSQLDIGERIGPKNSGKLSYYSGAPSRGLLEFCSGLKYTKSGAYKGWMCGDCVKKNGSLRKDTCIRLDNYVDNTNGQLRWG